MKREDLKQAILDYIRTWYNAEYVDFIEVKQEDNLYSLSMGIPSYLTKTHISGEFETDELFLEYIYKEIRERNYMRVYFYKVIRTDATTREK